MFYKKGRYFWSTILSPAIIIPVPQKRSLITRGWLEEGIVDMPETFGDIARLIS